MSYQKPRIDITDNVMEMVTKLAEGNPGAISVLMKLFQENAAIDPDSAFGPYSSLLALDTNDIYGSRIWQFYKDLCRQSLVKMIGLLRAVQLGMLSESKLHGAISSPPMIEWVDGYVEQVRAELPSFGKAAA